MIEKTVSEIRINGKVVNNLNSLYWGETDTKYIVEVPKTLEEYTWTEINEIACNGLAPVKFKIGDTKIITMNTGEKITVRIIGFDHDEIPWTDGKKAKITFETVDLVKVKTDSYKIGYADTSSQGYTSSKVNALLRDTDGYIFSNFPSDLRNLLISVRKYYKNSSTTWSATYSSFKMFILSESEIFGTTELINVTTGNQYSYYANNNNAQARIKKADDTATGYWLRDKAYETEYDTSEYTNPVTIVYSNGYLELTNATRPDYNGYGVSFAFCIGEEPDAPKTPLDAPVITISVSTISWVAVSNATNYAIYLNGSHFMYTNKTSVDLSENITTAGTYTVQVKAMGSGSYSDSELSNSVTYTKPNTAITVIFRRADTAEFAQGFTIDIQCGTQSLWFGEYDYDEAKSITIPSSGTAIKVTFNGVSGTNYTNARYVAGSVTGTKTVSTSKTVTVYASSNNEIIDISYCGTN